VDLGTGIFLSSVVLAVVLLYGITKDRWSWRRIVKRTALVLLCTIVLGTVIGVGIYQWQQLPQKPERQTSYAGLRLGMTQDEVTYVKGYPPFILIEDEDKGFVQSVDATKLEKGKHVNDYQLWSYGANEHYINVIFNPTRTAVVNITCVSLKTRFDCPYLAGVQDGDSEQDVLRKLGTPTSSKIEGSTKEMTYRDLNVRVRLTKERVYMLAVRDPSLP
jgi:hypothetical protein